MRGQGNIYKKPCRNDRNRAGIGISQHLLQLIVLGQLGLREH